MKNENFKEYGSSHPGRDVPELFLERKENMNDKWRSSFLIKLQADDLVS